MRAAERERFPEKFLEKFDIIETQAIAITDRDREVLIHQIQECDVEPGYTHYMVVWPKYPELNQYIDYMFQKQQRTWPEEDDGFRTSFVKEENAVTIDCLD
jgi:hypothetical protein